LEYDYLLDIALILFGTKLLGLMTRRVHMPSVVGSLLAGVMLGPAVFNIIQPNDFLARIAQIGVIFILFNAGMETDIKELKKTGVPGLMVALGGGVVPLGLGTLAGFLFSPDRETTGDILQYVYIGVILTATSVSITVETLRELGKLSSRTGNTILAASLLDDILGLFLLAIVSGVKGGEEKIWVVFLKVLGFFVFVAVAYVLFTNFLTWYENRMRKNLHRYAVLGFVLCLIMAYIAEEVFGVADIIGAFAAGLIIATTPKGQYTKEKLEPMSYVLFAPVFFATIGMKMEFPKMEWDFIIFTAVIVFVAVFSKLIGCGLGAKLCKFDLKDSIRIGLGMACRGEVALIVTNKGVSAGVIPSAYFGPIIIVVLVCSVFTPIALKLAYREKTPKLEPKTT